MKRRAGLGGSMRSVVGFLSQRGLHGDPLLTQDFQRRRLRGCRNLYKKDLLGHFGCVNAIEFSNNGGQWLVSGKSTPLPSPPRASRFPLPAAPCPFPTTLLLPPRPVSPHPRPSQPLSSGGKIWCEINTIAGGGGEREGRGEGRKEGEGEDVFYIYIYIKKDLKWLTGP